ncbi:MAG TPA: YifB family Mg chelatase-like AAA ATPase [Candidatus Paceibacterota bacterium]|nr:YifB family Mg chelatase-like AAA ATPase [Candidatus Paceibacterota bacterium]
MHFARVFGAQPALPKAHVITVETDMTKGLHSFSIVGLPDKSVAEARDRVASAIKNTEVNGEHFSSPKSTNKKIVISLAPAELKKEGAVFDVPAALSYLLASHQVNFKPEKKLFAGELALDGTLAPIRGALSIARTAKEKGFSELYVPSENAPEASLVSGIAVFPVSDLHELVLHLTDDTHIAPYKQIARRRTDDTGSTLDDIRGQENAKRALEIAVAGRHNIALYGPPGTGKTMLARAAVALLPDLTEDESIEVTMIHSLAGALEGGVITRPPFRSPHHTASYASIIGGGSIPRPGEVTLAHRGVLFVDEFPEFHRDVINALREPLEDRIVSVARAKSSAVYPANFMLIAALNPCPCGFWGGERCQCMPHIVEKYRRKISGPIADRIDLWVTVPEIPPESLSSKAQRASGETKAARERIEKARKTQEKRFAKARSLRTNADMRAKDIETLAKLSDEAETALIEAARRLKLSPRGYHRTIKLARTIADLGHAEAIETPHMLEALQYRAREM